MFYLLQAICNQNAELVRCAAALRDLKLLVGSGGLDFDTWHGFLRQICRINIFSIFFGNASHLSEHGQLKGWPPHFEPTVAKNSISTIVHWFVAFVTWKHGAGIG